MTQAGLTGQFEKRRQQSKRRGCDDLYKAASNPTTGQANPLPFTPIEDADINKAKNQFATGTTYDEAGQVIQDNKFRSMEFSYDANGRVVEATKANSPEAATVYDALGNRVATKINDVWQFGQVLERLTRLTYVVICGTWRGVLRGLRLGFGYLYRKVASNPTCDFARARPSPIVSLPVCTLVYTRVSARPGDSDGAGVSVSAELLVRGKFGRIRPVFPQKRKKSNFCGYRRLNASEVTAS